MEFWQWTIEESDTILHAKLASSRKPRVYVMHHQELVTLPMEMHVCDLLGLRLHQLWVMVLARAERLVVEAIQNDQRGSQPW